MSGKKIGAIIALDGEKEFRSAVTGVNRELTNLKSQLELTKEKFSGQANSLEALKARHEALTNVLDAQKRKMDAQKEGMDHAKESYNKVGDGLEKLRKDYDAAQKKMEEMKKSSSTTEDELNKQKKAVSELAGQIQQGEKNYETAGNKVNKWQSDLNKAETEVIKTNRELKKNTGHLKEAQNSTDRCAGSIDKFGKEVRQTSTELETSGKNVEKFSEKSKEAVNTLSAVMVAAGVARGIKEIGEALYECVEASERFETGMQKVYTIADENAVSVDSMKEAIVKLSGETGIAAENMANNVYDAISAGQSTADSVSFVSNATKLATAGFAESGQTLDVLTTILNAYGMESKKTTSVSDMLIQTQNKGKVTVGELAGVMGKIIPTANASNVALDQLCAGYAITTSKGIKAAESTTYMNSMLTELSKSGTTASNTLKETTGSSFQELMENGSSLGEVLNILQQQAEGNGKSLSDMFGSAEAGRVAVTLLSDGVAGFNSQLEGMRTSTGATEKAFEKMASTAEFQKGRMVTAFDNLKIAIGDRLSPSLKKLYESGADAFEWATDFVKNNPGTVQAITALVGAMGGLLVGLAGFTILKQIIPLIKMFNIALASNPVVFVATAILTLIGAFAGLRAAIGETETDYDRQKQKVEELATGLDNLKQKAEESGKAFEESTGSVEAQYGALDNMSSRLYDLADKEMKSNAEKAEMKMLVDQLNGAMPGLNLAIDAQTGALNKNESAVKNCVKAQKEKAMNDLIAKRMAAIYEEQAEAQVKAAEASRTMQEADAKAKAIAKELADVREQSTEASEKAGFTATEVGYKVSELVAEEQKQKDIVAESKEALKGYTDQYNECGNKVTDFSKTLEYGDKLDLANDKTGELTETTGELGESMSGAEESTKAAETALENLRNKYEEIKQSIKDSIDNKIDLFSAFDGGEEIGPDKMLENLKSQLEGVKNWKDNMQTLASEVGKTIGPELFNLFMELGPEAANGVQEMVNAINEGGESGKEKIKQLSSTYAEYLDFSDEASDKLANVKTVIEAALGEMGSSDADFSDLTDSFDQAVEKFKGGSQEISTSAADNFRQAVDAARSCGVEIPEGLADSILDGSTTVESAAEQLNGAMQAKFDFLAGLAADAGINIPQEITDGIAAGGAQAQEALQQLAAYFSEAGTQIEQTSKETGEKGGQAQADGTKNKAGAIKDAADKNTAEAASAANSHQMEFNQAGANAMQSMASGMSGAAYQVSAKAGEAASNANNSAALYQNAFRNTGTNLAQGLADGFIANSEAIVRAARDAVNRSVTAAINAGEIKSPSRVMRNKVGIWLARGMAAGITDGQTDVVKSTLSVCRATLTAAREELGIHSPSKAFIKFGKNITDGLTIGIEGKKASAIKASKKLSQDVYNSASVWMKEYKKSHSVSLKEEETFWDKVVQTVQKKSKAYNSAVKNAKSASKALSDINKQVKSVSISRTKDDKNKTRKTDAEYYKEFYNAAKQHLQNYETQHKLSLQEEKAFWQGIASRAKKGTQGYYNALGQVKDINAKIKKEITSSEKERKELQLSNSSSFIEGYKTYYNVSEKAEMQYWDKVRKQFKAGTAERLEADQKYFESKKSYTDKLKDLEDDYKDKCQEVTATLKDNIEDLNNTYNDAVKDRADSIYNSFGLFDAFYSESESGKTLLHNLETQVAGYADWEKELQNLGGRNILSTELMDELKKMGPEASAAITALNNLTSEELKRYQQLNQQKKDLSKNQAETELESMRTDTITQIQGLRTGAQKELNKLKEECEKATAGISQNISGSLLKFADSTIKAGENVVAGLLKGITEKNEKDTKPTVKKIQREIVNNLGTLPQKGNALGGQTLDGILEGLNNTNKIKKGAKEAVDALRKAFVNAADIHSPSRLFKKDVGIQIIAGVEEGITEGSSKAITASVNSVRSILNKSGDEIKRRRIQLGAATENLNSWAGISALNNLTQTNLKAPEVKVSLNDGGTMEIAAGVLKLLQEYLPQYRQMDVRLDSGELVGAITPKVGNNLAASTRRLTR